ncbi:MAG: hypothetical protein ACK4K1_04455 [Flavobacterium sp.]
MSETILKKIISNHDDERIKNLNSKSIMEITNTNFKTEEEFFKVYNFININKNRFLDVDINTIRTIYDKRIPEHRIKFTILKIIYYIPTFLFLTSIYLPFHFGNYWLFIFLISFKFSGLIGSALKNNPFRTLFWIYSIILIIFSLIFSKFDVLLIILIQVSSGLSVLFCKKYYWKLILKIVVNDHLIEKFFWLNGFIYYINSKSNEKLISSQNIKF